MVSAHSPANIATRRLRTDTMLLGNFSSRDKKLLDKAFDALGEDNVDRLVDGGITIRLRDPFETEVESHTARYIPDKKLMEMSASRMTRGTLVHELGHALDDLAEPDKPPINGEKKGTAVLKSQVDTTLQKLHQDYCQRVEELPWYNKLLNWGGGLWSDYATSSPQEYLAEGVRMLGESERTKARLQRDDPALASYVESLLHPAPVASSAPEVAQAQELGMLMVA